MSRRRNPELGRKQRTALLALVNGTWYHVDKQIKDSPSDDLPVFIGVGSGFDILRYVVWTFAPYGRSPSIRNLDLGDIIEAVATAMGTTDEGDNIEVRVAEIPTHIVRGENIHEITGETKDFGVYFPAKRIYGPRLPRSTRIDPK